jgi:hypothetical protein
MRTAQHATHAVLMMICKYDVFCTVYENDSRANITALACCDCKPRLMRLAFTKKKAINAPKYVRKQLRPKGEVPKQSKRTRKHMSMRTSYKPVRQIIEEQQNKDKYIFKYDC